MAIVTSRRWSRSSGDWRARSEPGRRGHRLPAPPHPHDPGHPVRLPRPADPPVTTAELRELYREAYAGEPFVEVMETAPATKHVTGSNLARVFVTATSAPGASSPSASWTTSSRARPARRSRRSTWSSACPRRRGWSSVRSPLTRRDRAPAGGALRRACPRSSRGAAAQRLPCRSRHRGLKASGRPDLSVVLVEGARARCRDLHPQSVRIGARRSCREHLAHVDPAGGGRYGRVAALLAVSGCANAATGARV